MTARARAMDVGLLLAGGAVAVLWPLTAYKYDPLLFPALVLAVLAVVVIVQRPEYGIAIGLALAPLTNLPIASEQFSGRPLRMVLPGLAALLVVYGVLVVRQEGKGSRPLIGAVILFVGVALASSVAAIAPSSSLTKLFGLVTAAALFFAVTQICQTRRHLVVVAGGAVAGLLVASVQGVGQNLVGDFSELGFVADGEIVERVQGSFGHPNQYAGFLAVLMPLAGAMAVSRAFAPRVRWLAGVALAVAMPALMLSYTRGALAGLVLGSMIWLALIRPRIAFGVAVVVTIAAVTLAPGALKDRFTQGDSGDVSIRADLWGSALDIYSDRPLIGVGLNNFEEGYARLPATLANASQRRLLHQGQVLTPPHAANLYLNILAEEGLIGIFSFFVLAAAAVVTTYKGCRVADPGGRMICLGIGAGLATLGVHSMLEVTLFSEANQPLFALLGVAATYVALDRGAEGEEESPGA